MAKANWVIDKHKKKWADPVIEPLLWDYPQYKLDMDMQTLEPNCISNYDGLGMPLNDNLSDPTASYGVARAMDSTANICRRIELIHARLRPELQAVCELYYWQKMKPSQITMQLQISYLTFWRLRHDLLYTYQQQFKRMNEK